MMNFTVKPPLEHIALVKIAAILWNQSDIRALVKKISNSEFSSNYNVGLRIPHDGKKKHSKREEWKEIVKKVTDNGTKLMIPMSLKPKLLRYIQPIGEQIIKWIMYHRKYFRFNLELPSEFCWTPQGTINKKETAKMLIKDENIDITTRYKLACTYCLEGDIIELWKGLPVNEKHLDYQDGDSKILKCTFRLYWEHYVNGESAETNNSADSEYLIHAAVSGNKAAVEYFLQKIRYRVKILIEAASVVARVYCNYMCPKIYYNEVLCFLLSQMTHDQLVKVFEKYPLNVLRHILDWPFQSFFVEMTTHLWNFLPETSYISVLTTIILKVRMGYKDYNYQEVFRDVWQQIPRAHKSSIINDDSVPDLLNILLLTRDKQNLKLIFQDANPVEKIDLFCTPHRKKLLRKIFNSEDLDFLFFYMQLCISSSEDLKKFKHEDGEDEQKRIARFFQLCYNLINTFKEMTDIAISEKKRTMDDDDYRSAKKARCNLEDKAYHAKLRIMFNLSQIM